MLPDYLKISAAELGHGSPVKVRVLGDMASAHVHKPWVVSYSNTVGMAPVRLTRTVQDAVAAGAGSDAGGPRAVTQWARLAEYPIAHTFVN